MDQNNAGEIMVQSQEKLIEILNTPDAPVFAKAKACQRLAVVGDRAAVPALSALLKDPQMAHYARFGLQPNPDPAVDEALRDALGKLKGRLKVGVIHSMGCRKNPSALKTLEKLMSDRDPEVAGAAATAVGRIGGADAAKTLERALRRGKPALMAAVGDAALECAEGLLGQGKREQALALYRAVESSLAPEPVKAAAARGARPTG